MKAIVDPEICIGCGLCAETCPEVYDLRGDLAVVIADPVPPEHEASAKSAAEACPVDAIRIES